MSWTIRTGVAASALALLAACGGGGAASRSAAAQGSTTTTSDPCSLQERAAGRAYHEDPQTKFCVPGAQPNQAAVAELNNYIDQWGIRPSLAESYRIHVDTLIQEGLTSTQLYRQIIDGNDRRGGSLDDKTLGGLIDRILAAYHPDAGPSKITAGG